MLPHTNDVLYYKIIFSHKYVWLYGISNAYKTIKTTKYKCT